MTAAAAVVVPAAAVVAGDGFWLGDSCGCSRSSVGCGHSNCGGGGIGSLSDNAIAAAVLALTLMVALVVTSTTHNRETVTLSFPCELIIEAVVFTFSGRLLLTQQLAMAVVVGAVGAVGA